ncbi:MAG TPA: flagellar basal-body MS-ring/collar protein FliF [Candidatus Competibacteraceae bacterium]|nr:flagellar M-ring protein FliF [Gammaproteobacteria bacterium]HPF60161.1 flagellar basal-body MS-ring/collar protein FliF [Candidatus Competibacteraceae bacterium]HRY19075.1 flagellar basal-body MS-ring/collar protein FliF [Candidatus Competibacteraceae bacterium]
MTEENNGSPPNLPARIDWRAELEKFRRPGPAQIGIMAGAALLLALLVAFALWYSAPAYDVLYRGLAEQDAGHIMDALQKSNIPFKIDTRSGALMVPSDQVHEARLKLAGQGLPRGTINGLEALEQQNSFGISQFMETTRYQHALEGELARSVMTISAVESARVHLAFPKETVFARQQQPPTASVLVRLHPGRILDEGQVAAIVHLIASSVPKLKPAQVSVINQAGDLLTRNEREGANNGLNLDQLEYARRIEERYARRIEDLLSPVWGAGRVRAQVSLDVDFTTSEETAERYEPRDEPRPIRSEQLLEENNPRQNPMGIPGALSNQPPGVAVAPEVVAPPANPQNPAAPGTTAETAQTAPPAPTRKEVTRNYELDRRLTQVRSGPGRVLRVSAAVVIDDRVVFQEGKPVRTPVTPEEIERITELVKQAVGFNAERGDSVNVFNATFAPSSLAALDSLNALDELPLPMWQQAWFLELVKWAVIGLLSLLILLFVVRPVMRRLLPPPVKAAALESDQTGQPALTDGTTDENGLEGLLEDQVQIGGTLENGRSQGKLSTPIEKLEERMDLARSLVSEDPKRAVQVIKNWLTSEA